jgi:hypothetical protein
MPSSATGPIPPIAIVKTVIIFLVLSDKFPNFSKIFPKNSKIGVTACRNASPTGTRATLNLQRLF